VRIGLLGVEVSFVGGAAVRGLFGCIGPEESAEDEDEKRHTEDKVEERRIRKHPVTVKKRRWYNRY
jgi:hypothetical protein